MDQRIPIIAGNWKMNLSRDESLRLVRAVAEGMRDMKGVEVLVAPPFLYLSEVQKVTHQAGISLAGQNMHWETHGAFTGEVSGQMLKDVGCSHCILGHSERRSLFYETDEMVNRKVKTALSLDLVPIICIGETLEERESEQTVAVIQRQLEGSLRFFVEGKDMPSTLVLAYEPVWAIGTGRTATPQQAQDVHAYIRGWISKTFSPARAAQIRILYGGSVKPDNIAALMAEPDIDGALVGGASLKPEPFLALVHFRKA